ncbi:hypothetical protein PVBG_06169 [Plasmodium vivax Brazil I]|uniref:VIR protein n=1 Tax=Plasmodium vivax (strain Brazil I) TaxID=1033975 RepID=A0A0J9SPS1_PLAV1|nr:hypothetical protein PVBG_06169 [Plasmodium vivax Brazil I]
MKKKKYIQDYKKNYAVYVDNEMKSRYFNYDCYTRLSYYFDGINFSETSQKYFNDYIQSFANQRSFVKQNNDLLTYLAKRLGGDGLFIDIGYDICCTYINYLLNYKIENKNNGSLENYFENFKNFAHYYAEKKHGKSFNQNTCESYLKPIFNEKKYNTMKILYKMYYYFNLVKSYTQTDNKVGICNNYGLVNKFYRDLKQIYNTNTDLMEKLNYFGNVIKSSERSYDALCGNNLLILISPPPVSKPAQETTVISGESSSTYVASNLQNPKVSEPHVEGTDSANQQDLLITSQVAESPREVQSKTELEQEKIATRALPGLSEETHHIDHTFDRSNERTEVEINPSGYGVFSTEGGLTSIHGQLPQTARQEKGLLTNVQDTFFSIVKDVDPAPVLGVSGGMGVLFILFKVFKALI